MKWGWRVRNRESGAEEASRHDVSGGVLLNIFHQLRMRLFEQWLAEIVQLRKEFDQDKSFRSHDSPAVDTDCWWTKHKSKSRPNKESGAEREESYRTYKMKFA